jgi:two-component system, NarL family, sensor histidine kinase UhpB
VLQAQEEERKRIARDLHDEVNQALTALLLRIEAVAQDAPPALQAELAETKKLANQAMGELLDLARQLRPAALDDHGLVAALRTHVREQDRRGAVRASFWADPALGELAPEAQVVIYRVAQEALVNAARHSGATRIEVALERHNERHEEGRDEPHDERPGERHDQRHDQRHDERPPSSVILLVADNGRGFAFAEESKGLGLSGMRERALLVGAKLEIDSRPGKGTTVRLEVPTHGGPEADGAEDNASEGLKPGGTAALHGAGTP